MSGFFNAVYEVVKSVPEGKVITYGDAAQMAGSPRASRQVGWALHCNPQPGIIPCHRVVFKDGSLSGGFAFGGRDAQKALLLNEGVKFIEEYKVDLKNYRYTF